MRSRNKIRKQCTSTHASKETEQLLISRWLIYSTSLYVLELLIVESREELQEKIQQYESFGSQYLYLNTTSFQNLHSFSLGIVTEIFVHRSGIYFYWRTGHTRSISRGFHTEDLSDFVQSLTLNIVAHLTSETAVEALKTTEHEPKESQNLSLLDNKHCYIKTRSFNTANNYSRHWIDS